MLKNELDTKEAKITELNQIIENERKQFYEKEKSFEKVLVSCFKFESILIALTCFQSQNESLNKLKNLEDSLNQVNKEKNDLIIDKSKLQSQIDLNNLQIENHLQAIKELNESKIRMEKEKIEYLDLLKVNANRDDADKADFNNLKSYFDKVSELNNDNNNS